MASQVPEFISFLLPRDPRLERREVPGKGATSQAHAESDAPRADIEGHFTKGLLALTKQPLGFSTVFIGAAIFRVSKIQWYGAKPEASAQPFPPGADGAVPSLFRSHSAKSDGEQRRRQLS